MSSDKRNFKEFNNKEVFNYTIEKGVLVYGNIYNKQKTGNVRLWRFEVRLFYNDEQLNITKTLINKKLDESYHTIINRYSGLAEEGFKITKTKDEIITIGKNIGKANETSVLTQSIIIGRSDYLKKMKAGYVEDVDGEREDELPFPMALNDYSKHKSKLKYPVMIQPKIDGLRAIFYKMDGEVKIMSRRHQDINGFDNIKSILDTILVDGVFLDGELYYHGMSLQEISGIVRNEEKSNDNHLQFWIFDMFDLNNPDMLLMERFNWINDRIIDSDYINLIDSTIVDDEDESDALYNNYLKNGYEGVVYKSLNKNYEFSFTKEIRSNYYLKRKPFFDEEYLIVDYDTDKNGAILFILETKEGKTFRSVPMGSIPDRIELAKKINFKRDYYKKMATIRYDDKSNSNIPVRARFVSIRNEDD